MIVSDLDLYLTDLAQRAKPSTVEFYRGRSQWIRKGLVDRDWKDIEPREVLSHLDRANRWPTGQKKGNDTQRGNTIAWEQLQKWAIDTGRIAEPVTGKITKPPGKIRERLPTLAEIQQITEGAPAEFRAIYRALLLTGARPGELCRATIADFDRQSNVIVLKDHKTKGKTGQPRLIPISQHCLSIVAGSIGDRTEGPLFPMRSGRHWTTAKLSQAFRRRRNDCKISHDLKLYCTRHKFATELCRALGIEATASVLGHAVLQTTKRYVHQDTAQLRVYADGVDPSKLLPGM